MHIKSLFMLFGLCGALGLAGCAPAPTETADLILTNARIYTVNDKAPWAEALAIKGDRIVYVGDAAGADTFFGPATERKDLNGRFVMPGIIDGHTHPGMMNVEQYGPAIPEEASHEELLAAVKAYADSQPGDGWIRMCCWSNEAYLENGQIGPLKTELDKVVPDRPVWITSGGWHSYWLNSKGLETLGVTRDTADPIPDVANYVRDENGELTGWIKEGAGWQFFADHFPLEMGSVKEGIDISLNALSRHGVTTVYDGGNWDYEDEIYGYLSELDRAGKLPVRYEGTYMVYLPERRHVAVRAMRRLQEAYGGDRLKFRTIKLFMDGVTDALAAGMLEPYSSHPDETGDTALTTEELRDWLLELHTEKFDLHIHTIGDLAVRRALDAVEAARNIVGKSFYPRVTLAHLEVVDEADWSRFEKLGVSANFTPWWFGGTPFGEGHLMLGEERANNIFPAKDLIVAGGNVTFSSDEWFEEQFTPFLGIQVGHNRQFPDEWLGEEVAGKPLQHDPNRVALEEMIRGYTARGAYPFRLESSAGTLEVGKLADLLVLEESLMDTNRRTIHKIKPSVVMMEGKVIHGTLD